MDKKSQILELEKRILAERNELDNIIASYQDSDDYLINNKLKFMQAELDYLNNQFIYLSNSVTSKVSVENKVSADTFIVSDKKNVDKLTEGKDNVSEKTGKVSDELNYVEDVYRPKTKIWVREEQENKVKKAAPEPIKKTVVGEPTVRKADISDAVVRKPAVPEPISSKSVTPVPVSAKILKNLSEPDDILDVEEVTDINISDAKNEDIITEKENVVLEKEEIVTEKEEIVPEKNEINLEKEGSISEIAEVKSETETVKTETKEEKSKTLTEEIPPIENFEVEETIEIKTLPKTSEPENKKENNKKSSIENKIGLMVMPVLAAILIFVSVILFANALPEAAGNVIKQITMYVAGFAFIGTGLFLNKKKKGGAFGQVLMSIGAGELFISIIISRFVFASINDLVLYILIILWSGLLTLLKRYSSILFQVIGEIGVATAVIFGVCYLHSINYADGFYVIIVFNILTALIFYFLFRFRGSPANLIVFHAFNMVKLTVLSIGFLMSLKYGYALFIIGSLTTCFLSFMSFVDIIATYKADQDKKGIFCALSNICYSLLSVFDAFAGSVLFLLIFKGQSVLPEGNNVFDLLSIFDDQRWVFLAAAGLTAFVMLIITELFWESTVACYFVEGSLSFVTFCLLISSHETFKYGFIVVIAVLTALGYLRKNHLLKITALVFYVIYAFIPDENIARIAVGLLTAIALLILIYVCKEQYFAAYKICVYFSLLIYSIMVSFAVFDPSNVLGIKPVAALSCITVLNLMFMFTPLSKSKEHKYDLIIIPEICNVIVIVLQLYTAMLIERFGGTIGYLPLLEAFALTLIALVRGFAKSRIICKITALISLFFALGSLWAFDYSGLWFAGIIIVIGIVLLYLKEEWYSLIYKIAIFILALCYCILCTTYFYTFKDLDMNIAFNIVNVMLITMLFVTYIFRFTPLSKSRKTKENDFYFASFSSEATILFFTLPAVYLMTGNAIFVPIVLLAVISIIWLIQGFVCNRIHEKVGALSVIFLMMFFCRYFPESLYMGIAVVLTVLFFAFLYAKEENYYLIFKYVLYAASFINLIIIPVLYNDTLKDITGLHTEGVVLIAEILLSFLFKYTILSKNPVEKEKDFFIPTVVTDCMAALTASVLMVTFKDEGNFVPCIAVAVIAINWLIHGFLTNDFTEKVLLLSEMALMLVISMWIPASFYTLFVIAIFATFLFMLYKCEDSYLFVFKVIAYVFLMINSIVCPMLFRATLETFDIFITGNVVLLSLAVVNTVFRFTPLVSNPDTDEDDMKVLTIIVDNVLVLYGLMMTFVHDSPADILTGVITLILIPIGTAWIWTDEEDNTVEKYLAVTEYVFVPFLLCYGWNTPAYISSIIGLALAVGCIVLGFGVKMKGIRIYGLAVSMIMIFKLALVDFEKSSFMAYALSFFIAGISCLIISMLYYFVNAAMADKE